MPPTSAGEGRARLGDLVAAIGAAGLSAVLEQTETGILVAEAGQGRVVYANARMASFYGFGRQSTPGTGAPPADEPPADALTADALPAEGLDDVSTPDAARAPLRAALEELRAHRDLAMIVEGDDQTVRALRVTTTPVCDDHGALIAVIQTAEDVTDTHRLRQATAMLAAVSGHLQESERAHDGDPAALLSGVAEAVRASGYADEIAFDAHAGREAVADLGVVTAVEPAHERHDAGRVSTASVRVADEDGVELTVRLRRVGPDRLPFSDADDAGLRDLARRTATSLSTMRARQARESSRRRLALLNQAMAAVATGASMEQVASEFVSCAVDALSASGGSSPSSPRTAPAAPPGWRPASSS